MMSTVWLDVQLKSYAVGQDRSDVINEKTIDNPQGKYNAHTEVSPHRER